ncbi:MAG: hypothetical protein Q9223_003636 [Gallowayella weberi]
MNLGEASLRSVNASRPALVHSASKQSVTASDDYYSLPSSNSSQDEKSAMQPYQTPPLHITPEPYRKTPDSIPAKPTVRAVTHTPPVQPDTAMLVGSSPASPAHKIKRKPISTQSISSSDRPSNNEPISPPTPGLDDTPYIQFAIEQLTRDEEVNQARHSRPPHGAPSRDSYSVERIIPDERLRLQQGLQSNYRRQRPPEPPRPSHDSSVIAIPATPTHDSLRFPTLDYLPKALRLPSLLALLVCCVSILAAITFSNIWSSRHDGLWRYDDVGTSRYFVFQYLPQLLAILILFCFYQTRYFEIEANGVWKWTAVEPVGWTLLALYTLLSLALAILIFKLRRDPSGLRWDPRSLADILSLFQRSNIMSDFYGSEARAGNTAIALPKKYTLRYWIAGKRSSEIFHGIQQLQAPIHGFRGNRESNEKSGHSNFDLESQHPLTASSLDSLQEDVHSPRIRYRWLPWFLKDSLVVAWIVIAVVLLLAFIIISFVNNATRKGFMPKLTTTKTSQGFSPADFLYSLVPCLIGMMIFLVWQPIDMYFRALQPFANLSSTRGSAADGSLLLDYTACLPVEVTIKAALAGDYKVAWISFISLLSATLPVLSGGVFTAQYFIPRHEVRVAANMSGFYALVVLVAICSLSFMIIWPRQKRRLPHDIRTLGQILSFVYESRLLHDAVFWQPRSKTDLVTRLLGTLTGDMGSSRYAFGVYRGRDGREHLGIDRLHRPESGEMFTATGSLK